jgi:hypothetical protein
MFNGWQNYFKRINDITDEIIERNKLDNLIDIINENEIPKSKSDSNEFLNKLVYKELINITQAFHIYYALISEDTNLLDTPIEKSIYLILLYHYEIKKKEDNSIEKENKITKELIDAVVKDFYKSHIDLLPLDFQTVWLNDAIKYRKNDYIIKSMAEGDKTMTEKSKQIQATILDSEVREFLTRAIEYSEELEKEIEQLRTQLAGCSVVALGGIKNPARFGDYGWSPAYQDVYNLRMHYDKLLEKCGL